MNCDTGEIVGFHSIEEEIAFFKTASDRGENFVPLKDKNVTFKELDEGQVENDEIKDLLCQIGKSINAPRGVRRRLEKKLYKARKRT